MQTKTLTQTASFGCPQAIAIELREVLPMAWTLTQEDDSFLIRGPMTEGWRNEVWRIARFVAYSEFVSLEQVDRSSHYVEQLVVSLNSRGEGYRIRFLLGVTPS